MRRLVPLLALAGTLAAAAPAAAATVTIAGAPAAGPARYDRVSVQTFGPSKARMVLVLVPGTGGGSWSVAPVARDLAASVSGLQVWALDRREDAFEDTAVFEQGDAQRSVDHYLGFKYRRVLAADVPYVGDWGLAVSLEDLRRVVLRARAGGRRKVILGGHSRGASTAAAYAAWDFAGRPGYRDLAGLVLIDGGLLGSIAGNRPGQLPMTQARADLAAIRAGNVFNDPLGAGIPEIGTIFLGTAATLAAQAPQAPSVLQPLPIVPERLRPPFAVTNEALLGSIFDKQTSAPGSEALRLNAGALAAEGDPRPWVSGERTPIQTFAQTFAHVRPNATEWYFPQRLILDIAAANPMRRDPVATMLGLRLWHTRRITTPLYAFQTDLTGGAVAAGARRLVRSTRITDSKIVSEPTMSHLDPVLAPAATNTFTETVVPFLRRLR